MSDQQKPNSQGNNFRKSGGNFRKGNSDSYKKKFDGERNERKSGERRFEKRGDSPRGDRKFGERGDRKFNDREQRKFNDRGDRKFNERGDRKFNDRGDRKFGDRKREGGFKRDGGFKKDRDFKRDGGFQKRGRYDEKPARPETDAEWEADRQNRKLSGREPYVPAEIQGNELDPNLRGDLKALGKDQAERVSRHLVACFMALEEDPAAALEHAKWAAKFGGRVASVREIYGSLLYQDGQYRESLRELRAAIRINGKADLLPMIADAERGMGRPQKALETASQPEVKQLKDADLIELMMVVAGAYADLGDVETALKTLEIPALRQKVGGKWQVRLWLAYADLLALAGQENESLKWVKLTADADVDEITDAHLRLGRAPRPRVEASFETDEQISVFDVEAEYEATEAEVAEELETPVEAEAPEETVEAEEHADENA